MTIQRSVSGGFFTSALGAIACAVGIVGATPSHAVDVTFTGPGTLTWESTANWVGGSLPTTSDVAVFTQNAGTTEPTINAAYSVGGLRFTNTGTTLIRGVSRQYLTIGASGITANVGAGAATIGSNAATANRIGVILGANQTWTNNSSNLLKKEQGGMSGQVTELGTFTLTYDGSGPIQHGGGIGGTGGLVKNGTGTTFVLGSNVFTGGVSVNAGTLLIDNNAAFGTGAVTITGGAIGVQNPDPLATPPSRTASNAMTWAGNFAVEGTGQLTSSGVITMSGGSRTVTVNAGSFIVSGAIGDAGNALGLIKSGSGLLTLGGANTYTGPTSVAAGTLAILGTQPLATGLVTINSGAALAGSGSTGGGVTLNSGSFIGFGQTNLTVGGTISFGGSFGIANLAGLSSATVDGTYPLLTGAINTTNLQNIGLVNAFDLGDGKEAYFTTDAGLSVSVVPEPVAGLALATSLGTAICWWRSRRSRSPRST
jgi:autotransporter-associated beta strand protein